MAKYSRIYGDGIEKHELIFRGTVFDFSMIPCDGGARSDKVSFEYQIHEKYPDVSIDELSEAGAGDIFCSNELEIFEILEDLEKLE